LILAGLLAGLLAADSPIDGNSIPSLDLERWRFIPVTKLTAAGTTMNATTVTAGGPGLIAGGAVPPPGDSMQPPTAAIWVSSDAMRWERVTPDAFRPLKGTSTVVDKVLKHGTRLVAIGKEEGPGTRRQLAVWTHCP
jgi:hypothetical protein